MTEEVGAYDAKTHLPQLLKRVAEGETIVITKHGAPVAVLSPYASAKRPDVKTAIEAIRRMRKEMRLDGLSIRELIEEGRM
jgi:prevent-host-death family protein